MLRVWSHLEQVDVAVRVAQTEDVLPAGVFGDGLDDAVIGQQGITRRQLLLAACLLPARLVEQQRAT